MNKIIEAQGILSDARSCVECIYMAASSFGLEHEGTDPIQVVADIANKKIEEAIALLDEYRGDAKAVDASPVPATPAAKPPTQPVRTKRKGK